MLLMTADKDIFQREAAMRSLALPVLDDGQVEATTRKAWCDCPGRGFRSG
jgi:hypothetical protein